MPMPREDRRCKDCIYFHITDLNPHWNGQCRYEPTMFPKLDDDWCGKGEWEKYSDITNQVETYGWDSDEYTWEEERKKDDQDKLYILVTYPKEKIEELECRLYNNKHDLSRNMGHASALIEKAFVATYDANDSWWRTEEFKEEGTEDGR